jgi:hypothetical protein
MNLRVRIRALLTAIVIAVALTACAKHTPTATPGTPVSTEQQIYADLVTAQAAIEGFRDKIGTFPKIKPQLNEVIASYNLAEAAFEDYEKTKSNPAELAKLPGMINDLKLKITSVETGLGQTMTQPAAAVH